MKTLVKRGIADEGDLLGEGERVLIGRLVRQWSYPGTSGRITSANNLEVLAMNVAHFFLATQGIDDECVRRHSERASQLLEVCRRFVETAENAGTPDNFNIGASWWCGFLAAWQRSSYARLEVSHKLAASLCLTDIGPGIEVTAPWEACSVLVPDGLLGREIARVFCEGCDPRYLVSIDGKVCRVDEIGDTREGRCTIEMLRNLVRGAFLALENPEQWRKPAGRANPKNHRSIGAPDFAQSKYLISKPLTYDLRQQVSEYITGTRTGTRKGASPTVQFIVRGHWRQQVHGVGRSLRKTIWIKPFWKGPEEGRILLRRATLDETETAP